jgi:cytosine/adenosine deaminase-related metal-dependent hydrolase
MALVIAGCIVPRIERPDAVFKGRVFLTIAGPSGSPQATGGAHRFHERPVVDVGDAFVLPGLIDLHNHIGYNTLPLWAEPKQKPHLPTTTAGRAPSYQS